MKNNKIYKLSGIKSIGASLLVLLISLSSCKKGLDINKDPNNPTDVPAATILPAAEANLAYTIGGSINRIAGAVIQHQAGHRGQPLEYGQYDLTPASTDNIWSSMYAGVLKDLDLIGQKSAASGDKVYLGVSQILKAYTYSVLTDAYGDIPFSDALGGLEQITPAYDKQEAIYKALIDMITNGVINIKSNAGINKPGSDDLIFSGDIVKWERFGNSLKLRLYNHLSKIDPTAAINFLNTNPTLIESNAGTAAVTFGGAASMANPIYQFDILSGRKDNAVAATIVNKMKALKDPRIHFFFYPIKKGANAGTYAGNAPGGDNDDSGETKFSRIGPAYGSSSAPVVFMSFAELNYIIAEVKLRGGDEGNADTAYKTAIRADFAALGMSVDSVKKYMLNPEIKLEGNLKTLMEQKWITMFQGSYEAWVDWRRTGFPVLTSPAINRTGGVTPRRFPYPQLEINLNKQSLINGPGIPVPYRTILTGVWWDKL